MKTDDTHYWTITDICEEAPMVKTLILKPQGTMPEFIAGQYLTVRIPGFEPVEGKSYSIASVPGDSHVLLTIKEIGTFSHALLAHKIGDTLTTSAPYGFFYPELDEERHIACIAGGIGITPIMSIMRSLLLQNYGKQISLFYSNRTVLDVVFRETITMLSASHETFTAHHFITREDVALPEFRQGRMSAPLITELLSDTEETDFFICGSIEFTKGMWKELRTAGVSSTQIYTEGFF